MRRWRLRVGDKGFTLPELIVFTLLLSALGGLAVVKLHYEPLTVQENNAKRQLDVAIIALAVAGYAHKTGYFPPGTSTAFLPIGSEKGQLDLCAALVPTYLPALPSDPVGGMHTQDGDCNIAGQKYVTGYSIKKSADNASVTVASTTSEGGQVIYVTRKL